jgi:hypothetical protein
VSSRLTITVPDGKFCDGCPLGDNLYAYSHSASCNYFSGPNSEIYCPNDKGEWEKSVKCRATIARQKRDAAERKG